MRALFVLCAASLSVHVGGRAPCTCSGIADAQGHGGSCEAWGDGSGEPWCYVSQACSNAPRAGLRAWVHCNSNRVRTAPDAAGDRPTAGTGTRGSAAMRLIADLAALLQQSKSPAPSQSATATIKAALATGDNPYARLSELDGLATPFK